MNKITKIFIVALFAMSANFALGQENTSGSNTGENSSTQPAAPAATINVTITAKGADCPASGTVESYWKWMQEGTPYPQWQHGTSANYTNPPVTVTLESISVLPPSYTPQLVRVTVKPDGHPEGNAVVDVNKPFNPVGITPGPCDGGVYHSDLPNGTQ
jgi:hypothetical protein